jgi:hypothetical protein
LLYAHDLHESENAASCFSNIVNNYSDISLAEFAENELEMLGIKSKELPKEIKSIESVEFNISNFPNPFNPSTNISYQLPEAARVTLKVYDMLGREVAKLVDREVVAGNHTATFDGSRLSSGIYFVRFMATPQNGNQLITKTMKMLMVK